MMFLETRILAQIEVEIPEQKKVKVSCSKKATKPHPQPLSKREGSQKKLFLEL
jgi:hypothetical protein